MDLNSETDRGSRIFFFFQKINCYQAGENVILFANHQSEGDAAFIPLLTEVSHPGLGEMVTYVAGDRVITYLLAKPFSMGKNLLCVNSKKHMNDIPELKATKMKQNLTTIKVNLSSGKRRNLTF